MRSKKEGGFALAMCLVMLAAATFIVVPTLSLMTNTYTVSAKAEDATKRFYAAEAGFQNTIYKMTNDQSLHLPAVGQEISVDVPESTLNGKPVSVKLKNEGPHYRVTSSAGYTMTGVTKVIGNTKVSSQADIFKYAVVSVDGDIESTGNPVVFSDLIHGAPIHANGDVEIGSNTSIDGNVSATGTISGGGYMYSRTPGAERIEPPVMDLEGLINEAKAGGIYTGNYVASSGFSFLGPIYINGNLTVPSQSRVTLMGTVFVTGTITVSTSSCIAGGYSIISYGDMQITSRYSLDPSQFPFIYSVYGNIKMTASSDGSAAIIYAPNGEVELRGSATIYGSIVGKSVDIGANTTICYPDEMRDKQGYPGISPRKEIRILSYTVE